MRILFVLDNGLTQPSAWVRGLQYREALDARGVHAEFVSHRPESLARLQARLARWNAPRLLRGLVKRASLLIARLREPGIARRAARFDVVYLLLVPSLPLYRRLAALGGPNAGNLHGGDATPARGPAIFLDLVDALWLPSRRRSGWEELPGMLALAHGVVTDNPYTAAYLRAHHPRVFIVPDPPQVEAFDRARGTVARDPATITLGWIGAPATCGALYAIFEPLERLFAKHPHLRLRLVGADPERMPRFEKVRWSLLSAYGQNEMVREALAFDIGLFPQFDTEEALTRGSLKAMVYMSGEAVAVCRRLGECAELIEDGVNGILADGPDEWFEKLDGLVQGASRRREIAAAGLSTVRERFTRERCLDQLLLALGSARG